MSREELIRKLTSRKFIMAVIGIVFNIMVYFGAGEGAAKQVTSILGLVATVLAYCFGEGLADSNRGSDGGASGTQKGMELLRELSELMARIEALEGNMNSLEAAGKFNDH